MAKTNSLMQIVAAPTLQIFFARVVFAAPSNRAARGFHLNAKTLHSIAGMKPQDSMRTSSLGIKSDQMRKHIDANQTHVGVWVHDEALQTPAPLLHATALKTRLPGNTNVSWILIGMLNMRIT